MNIFSIVAKIIFLLQKSSSIIIIFVTCHDVEWNPGTGLFYNLHYIIDQTFENVKLSCDTDIVHTLWLIKTKTGTLTSCKQNGSNLALADCL